MHSLRKSTVYFSTLNKTLRLITSKSATVHASDNDVKLKSWREIPGPSTLPLIGKLYYFLFGGSMYKEDNEVLGDILFKAYGPIARFEGHFGSPAIVLLFDAEAASQVLHGENWMPVRPGFQSLEYFRKKFYRNKDDPPDAPTGLISDHGEVWKKFRSTVNPIMLQSKTIKLYAKGLDEVAEDMVSRMRLKRNDKNMLEGKFDVEMNLWALESIGVVALGGRLNCLDPNLPEDSPAKKLIQLVHAIFKSADELDFKPSLWRYISTPSFKRAMKQYEDQIVLSKYFINKARKQFQSKDSEEEKGILEKLLEIDEKVAVIMATDMLFAGVDTAANTMIATLYLLAKNTEKQSKLRDEIKSKSDKQQYLKACLKESMRLMPVVIGNMRLTSKEYSIMGYRIPEKTYVTFIHQTMSVMEQHYPKPREFIPERWIVDKTDPLYHGNAHPFAYNPFGFGVRSCIGRRIAELEMETFLAKVIQNFHVEWFGPPLKMNTSSLNYMVGPFNFIFKDVK